MSSYVHMFPYAAPYTPTNLTVSQNGIRSVLVSWTPAGRPSRYIIYYHEQGFSFRRRTYAGENDTSITLSDLNEGKNYSVSIVAETALQSSEVGPVNVTISEFADCVYYLLTVLCSPISTLAVSPQITCKFSFGHHFLNFVASTRANLLDSPVW